MSSRRLAKLTLKLQKISTVTLPSISAPPPQSVVSIAIFSMPMIEVKFDGFTLPDSYCAAAGGINSFYVRWLEAVGVRCYIMQWDDPWEEQLELLQQVNGVLFPGGDLDHFQETLEAYFSQVKKVYQYALDRAKEDDPFFLWGTCQGFQMLTACAADDLSVVEPGFKGVECKMLPLELEPGHEDSKFFSPTFMPAHVKKALVESDSTLNVHRFGVTPERFLQNEKLSSAFKILATNVDENNRRFISILEHRHASIVGVQFHPEWPPYDYSDERVKQTYESIAVSQYISFFIRSQLRRNKHHWTTLRGMEQNVIERTPVTYEGFGWELFWSKAQREKVRKADEEGGGDLKSPSSPPTRISGH